MDGRLSFLKQSRRTIDRLTYTLCTQLQKIGAVDQANDNQFGAIYGATEPKCEGSPAAWAPYCPSALNPQHIGLWMCGTTTFDTLEIDDVYARDENALAVLW